MGVLKFLASLESIVLGVGVFLDTLPTRSVIFCPPVFVLNFWEDSDGDGVLDLYEGGTTAWSDGPADTDEDGIPDYLDEDSDNDGFTDSQEAGAGDEPRDTDGDGIYDFADTDSDGDGLSDADEADVYGTDPYDDDTDGDGFSDGAELAAGTDPDDAGSVIEGLYVTVDERSDVEHVFEFELSVQMGDVGFLIDTTGSMSGTMNAMASEFGTIITQLSAELPDAEYGAATTVDARLSTAKGNRLDP